MTCCLDTVIMISILLLLLLCTVIFARWRRNHVVVVPEGRAVLITGCDSGFGNQLARRLLDMGFTVFATCLFPDGEGAQSLLKYFSPGKVKVIRLDVTNDTEIAEVKQYVQNNLPAKGLWGIVSNAGISTWGPFDWHTIEAYRRVVDINLLGSIRTTLAFAPLIKKSKGRMVYMSSITAYVSMINGIYSMTKAAIERFCDSLRLEMMRNGVKVCLIEPGNYALATNIQPLKSADDIWDSLAADVQESYSKEYLENVNQSVTAALSKGSSKGHEVVDAIVHALISDAPKPRYLVASLAEKISVYLSLWLPTSVFDKILSRASV
ncbi:PREDICTED: short-chain dehydrogenase/reductase family 9C member 7-like [Nanorana parkeri]|uniref:short-chain dehydrogenase/reductase family 9C member 7-like n=1 Tax=Nanorana parkeri TaxID=125878 RepID=UPI000854D70A|nr:PREDICTED: short-chain dehydrogenase/reductase family 9C member 7-like [Nanorana parkeri]